MVKLKNCLYEFIQVGLLGLVFWGANVAEGQGNDADLNSTCTSMQRCIEPLQEYSNIKFATTPEELERVCPPMLNNLRCVENFASQCLPVQEQMILLKLYQGVKKIINGLCTDGTLRQEYFRHAPCLWEDQDGFEKCAEQYSTRLKLAEMAGVRVEDTHKQICCAFSNFVQCAKTVYLYKCGTDTAQYMERYLDTIARPVIQDSCVPFQNGIVCSSATRLHFTFPSILLIVIVASAITLKMSILDLL